MHPSLVCPLPTFETTTRSAQILFVGLLACYNNNNFTRVDVCDASLLGAPLFHGSELDKSWNGCCDDLAQSSREVA